ncbi:MAG: DUF2783 domain-containing protein [Aquincola sp.]|nr:DUF2783 domain-containing protein [Aquincola sp.]MDH4288488.1 DUF2783 domain-containing protein [Aquincola sp.]
MPLNTEPNFREPGVRHRWAYAPGDAFYQALIGAHQGLSDAQSELLNARLVLLLANHVGDLAVLREAIALARRGVGPGTDETPAA